MSIKVNHDSFVAWVERKFDEIQVDGDEVKVCDPWWVNEDGLPDRDFKCWINTDKCCYRAFKSNNTGSLIDFVADREGCSKEEAIEIVGGRDSLYDLEQRLIDFLKNENKENKDEVKIKKNVKLPNNCVPLTSNIKNPVVKWAREYIEKTRNLPLSNLMVCLSNEEKDRKYKNRIVIPYYDQYGKLIYFNTRALSKKDKIRYKGPDKEEFNVGKSDVLWMSKWPREGSKIYLTEGEFDAMALAVCGLNSGACGGKSLSDKQIQMLNPYRITLSFDADKAGKDVYKISKTLLKKGKMIVDGKPRVSIIRPPKQLKDWNNFLTKHTPDIIRLYIQKYESPCNEDTLAKIQFQEL